MYLGNNIINTLNIIFDKKENKNDFISSCNNIISFSKQKRFKVKPYMCGDDYVMSFEVNNIEGVGFEVNVSCKKRNIDYTITFSHMDNEWEVVHIKSKGYYLPPDYKNIGIKFLQFFIVSQYIVKNYWTCFGESSNFFNGLGIRKTNIEELSSLLKVNGVNDKPAKKEPDSVVLNKAEKEGNIDFIKVSKFECCRTRHFANTSGYGDKIIEFLNSDEYDNRKWFYDFYSSREDMEKAEEMDKTSDLWVMIERQENNVWYMECSNSDNDAVTKIKCNVEVTLDNNIKLNNIDIDHKPDEKEVEDISEEGIKRLHREFMLWHCIFAYSVLKNDFLVNKRKRGKRTMEVSYERHEIMWDASILHKIQRVKKELGLK